MCASSPRLCGAAGTEDTKALMFTLRALFGAFGLKVAEAAEMIQNQAQRVQILADSVSVGVSGKSSENKGKGSFTTQSCQPEKTGTTLTLIPSLFLTRVQNLVVVYQFFGVSYFSAGNDCSS